MLILLAGFLCGSGGQYNLCPKIERHMLTSVSICFDTQGYLDGLFLVDAYCSVERLLLCLCKLSEKLTAFSFVYVLTVT